MTSARRKRWRWHWKQKRRWSCWTNLLHELQARQLGLNFTGVLGLLRHARAGRPNSLPQGPSKSVARRGTVLCQSSTGKGVAHLCWGNISGLARLCPAVQGSRFGLGCWMLDVRCWMFRPPPPSTGFRLVSPRPRLSCPPANGSRIQTALSPGSPAPAGAVVQLAHPFCEDRGLLPDESLKNAFEHRDPYNPRPVRLNFRGLFRAIDEGNAGLNI